MTKATREAWPSEGETDSTSYGGATRIRFGGSFPRGGKSRPAGRAGTPVVSGNSDGEVGEVKVSEKIGLFEWVAWLLEMSLLRMSAFSLLRQGTAQIRINYTHEDGCERRGKFPYKYYSTSNGRIVRVRLP